MSKRTKRLLQPKVKPIYPKWGYFGGPTPSEELRICDTCGHSIWTTAGGYDPIPVCDHYENGFTSAAIKEKFGKPSRMRLGTPEEKIEAIQSLENVLGEKGPRLSRTVTGPDYEIHD